MTWIIAVLFVLTAWLNRNDKVKFLTASSFAVIHLFNCFVSFEYINFFYANILASLSLLLYPSLMSRRDWAWMLGGILTSCIVVDFYGIYNIQGAEDVLIGHRIDMFKYLATAGELVVLALAAHGRFNGYNINNSISMVRNTIWNIFNHHNKHSYIQRNQS